MFSDLALPGASLRIDLQWLPAGRADALLRELTQTLDWQVHCIRLFGRLVASPRRSCWIGDSEAVYRYSGMRFTPRPWTPALSLLREEVGAAAGVRFNSVLVNLYRDGDDAMGWHSDDEPELGPEPLIASLSLGGERRFVLKHRRRPENRLALLLKHGSLLLMSGETQRNYRHALPRTRKPVAPRINLTFRSISPKHPV